MTEENRLSNNSTDHAVSLAKALASLFPLGGVVQELLGVVIPRQRMDRFVDFVTRLYAKTESLEDTVAMLKEPPFADLFDDASHSAVKATSPERRQHIAALVGNALHPAHLDALKQHAILRTLDQLTDADVIMLNSYTYDIDPSNSNEPNNNDKEKQEYWARHKDILEPPAMHYGLAGEEYRKALEANEFHHGCFNRLLQLRLINQQYNQSTAERNKLPEFDDDTGKLKPTYTSITELGVSLLRQIDVYPPKDTTP